MQSDRLLPAIKTTVAVLIVLMVAASLRPDVCSSPVFTGLWALLALLGTAAVCRSRMARRPAVLAIHLAFLLMLAGAALTRFFSEEQTLHLREGETLSGGLPFEVTLEDFSVQRYPGTNLPADYVSRISIGGAPPQVLRMNHIVRCKGYRLHQSRYDEDEGGCLITAVHDPAGITVTYAGYALLFVALLAFFAGRSSAFRASLRRISKLCCVCACLLPGLRTEAAIQPDRLPDAVAAAFDSLYVYTPDGRITTIGALGYWDEHTLKLFPVRAADGSVRWYAAGDRLPGEMDTDEWLFIRKSMAYVEELLFREDPSGACGVLRKVRTYQCRNLGDAVPSAWSLACERTARTIHPGKQLAGGLLAVGLCFFLVLVYCLSRGRKMPVWFRRANRVVLWPVCLWLSLDIICLWVASGSVPMSGGNDLMLLVAWLSAVLGIVLSGKLPPAGTLCLLLCGFGTLVSALAMPHPEFSPVQPVLNTPLLALHVGCMMICYTLFALAAVCGMAGVAARHSRTAQQLMADLGLVLIYPAEAILAAGIFIGAVWADVSWGRYWSWDPKETWALITMLVYAAALHRPAFRPLSSAGGFNFFCIFAFAFVLFTWFGVSHLLGGMHSYA